MRSDPAVKQLILAINERMVFVIEDLDETHLLVDPSKVDVMRDRLEDEVRCLTLGGNHRLLPEPNTDTACGLPHSSRKIPTPWRLDPRRIHPCDGLSFGSSPSLRSFNYFGDVVIDLFVTRHKRPAMLKKGSDHQVKAELPPGPCKGHLCT